MPYLIVRVAKRAPDREIHKHRARGMSLLQNVAHGTYQERRDTQRLDAIGDETHGLVTEGSVRYEQRQVHIEGL